MGQTADRRTEVFVSTTTKDLGPVRAMVTQALLTIGCHPVVQETFPPDYRGVGEMLEDRIQQCDAVIHIVGVRYGEEPDPSTLPPDRTRRSYTMLEAEIGRRLRKKVYVFVCPEDFPYDSAHAAHPEPPDKQDLQRAYRQEVLADNSRLRTEIRDLDDMGNRVRELDLELRRLSSVITTGRRRSAWILTTLTLVLATLAAGVWWTYSRTPDVNSITDAVSDRVVMKLQQDVSLIRTQYRKTIEEESATSISVLQSSGASAEQIESVRKLRDLAIREVDTAVDLIRTGLSAPNPDPIYVEAVQTLQDKGTKATLEFLSARAGQIDDKIEQELLRKQRQTEQLRSVLRIRLLEAQTLEASFRFEEAFAIRDMILEKDATWMDLRLAYAESLRERGEVVLPELGNPWLKKSEQLSRGTLVLLPPDDRSTTWAITQDNLGNALKAQGDRTTGADSVRLLEEAVVAYSAALEVRTKSALPQDWAATQNNLGVALLAQGERATGKESVRLLGEAVAAYRAAMQVLTKSALPQDWATTQNNLGLALLAQGERATGEESVRLLDEAVSAYRAALEVFTKSSLPQDWAMTQINLGSALMRQADGTAGADSERLLSEAVVAYRAALEVFTKSALPQRWALTQNNLGIALLEQGERARGEESVRLLGEAVVAYRSALEVYTKSALPQDWAMTQTNLGGALLRQGERATGADSERLLSEAVVAFRAALEIHTKSAMPQLWGKTQHNLASVLRQQSERTSGTTSDRLLNESIEASRAAREVFYQTSSQRQYVDTMITHGNILVFRASLSNGEQRNKLLTEAVVTYRSALKVLEGSKRGKRTAVIQMKIGVALLGQSEIATKEESYRLLDEASAAYRSAIKDYADDSDLRSRANTQVLFGILLEAQAERTTGPESVRLLVEAVDSYRTALQVLTKSAEPQQWAKAQKILGGTLLTLGKQTSGSASLEYFGEAVEVTSSVLVLYPPKEKGYARARILGSLSYMLLYQRHFDKALQCAEEALELDSSETWIQTNRAHSLLFLERFDEAKAVYLKFADARMSGDKTFAQAVLEDFDSLAKVGVTHPDMARIRKLIEKPSKAIVTPKPGTP